MSKTLDEDDKRIIYWMDRWRRGINKPMPEGSAIDYDKFHVQQLKQSIGCYLLEKINKLHKECNCSRDGYAHWVKLDDIRKVFNKFMGVKG